jgi:hypothetical protein
VENPDTALSTAVFANMNNIKNATVTTNATTIEPNGSTPPSNLGVLDVRTYRSIATSVTNQAM